MFSNKVCFKTVHWEVGELNDTAGNLAPAVSHFNKRLFLNLLVS